MEKKPALPLNIPIIKFFQSLYFPGISLNFSTVPNDLQKRTGRKHLASSLILNALNKIELFLKMNTLPHTALLLLAYRTKRGSCLGNQIRFSRLSGRMSERHQQQLC